MNIERHRQQLLELERQLTARIGRETDAAQQQTDNTPGDVSDASVADELRDLEFGEAELDSTRLKEVREALERIQNGTYGRCVVDGKPIDEKRLEAMPWTPYCLEHQQRLEAGRTRAATL